MAALVVCLASSILPNSLSSSTSTKTDEIEDVMDDYGITYQELVPDAQTMQQYKEKAVWFVVENYCQSLAIEAEMDEYLAAA
jgi:hypothetical protein